MSILDGELSWKKVDGARTSNRPVIRTIRKWLLWNGEVARRSRRRFSELSTQAAGGSLKVDRQAADESRTRRYR
jgi:hypothetical protein